MRLASNIFSIVWDTRRQGINVYRILKRNNIISEFCNLDKSCVNETEESSFKSAICYSHELLGKKNWRCASTTWEKNKVFEISKSEGDCIKVLVQTLNHLELIKIQINFFSWDPN